MSYNINAHRRSEIEHDVHLVADGGPGWDDYVRAKVRQLLKEDLGLHVELKERVEAAIKKRNATVTPRGASKGMVP